MTIQKKSGQQSKNDVIFSPSLHEAFAEAEIPYPVQRVERGQFARFSTNNDPSDDAGWCKLFPDASGAAFGCHRSNKSFVWQQRDGESSTPTAEERKVLRRRLEKSRRDAEAEREAGYLAARQTAKRLWAESGDLDQSHRYVVRKGITAIAALQAKNNSIVVPIYDCDDELQTLQFITEDGEKRFMPKGKVSDGRLLFGMIQDGLPLILCEGWATGCSIHHATAITTVVAFAGNNLAKVARKLRERYPNTLIIVAADLDLHGAGLKYAEAAVTDALSVVITPRFTDNRHTGDFNDLHQAEGFIAVKAQFDAVMKQTSVAADPTIEEHAEVQLDRAVYQPFPVPDSPKCDVRDGTSSTRPLTELGNAQRIQDVSDNCLKFVFDANKWLRWDGYAWQWDSDGATARTIAAKLATLIYTEAKHYITEAEHFAKWARQSQKEKTIKSSVAIAQDFSEMRLSLAFVDADQMTVGFDDARQLVDLCNGLSRLTKPDDYITKTLNVAEVGSAAQAVRWKTFLEQIFENDLELIDWLQRFCGYLLTGSTDEQFFLFCYGHGANGKSVFIETLKYIMGDYSRAIAPETLAASRRQAGAATPDLVPLIGARLAISSETEDNTQMAETFIKGLVSGDSMSARANYGAQIDFKPRVKLIMAGNHQPRVNGTDHGIWRRVRLVPFKKTFAAEDRDPMLLAKLKGETPHIFAWMLEGCKEWRRRGLSDIPTAIRNATDEYRVDQDVLGTWLSECTEESQEETGFNDLYANYKAWCADTGLKAASSKVLGRRLKERNYKSRKSSGKLLYEISLTDSRHLASSAYAGFQSSPSFTPKYR